MLEDFLEIANQRIHNYPEERTGQAFMNALWFYSPEIHDAVHATEYDCFYNDTKVPVFLLRVAELISMKNSRGREDSSWPAIARSIWPDGEQV